MSDSHGSVSRPSADSDAPTGQLRQSVGLTIEVIGLTDKGCVRPGNEDSLIFENPASALARNQGALLVVSDGMGGHAAGEVASQIAVETIHSVYYRNRGMPPDQAVHDAISRANTAIFDAAQQDRERAGMGCTVVALVVQGADLTIGHVGDSRAYLIRGGRATQLTLDHSWVAMQVHEGILTPEQAEHHPNRSVLMRALGRQASVEVDISHRQLQPGDILLVCSDGLTGMVTDAEIADYASRIPPADLPRQLVDLANSRGAPDNVTVLIGAIHNAPTALQAAAQAKAVDPNSATTVIAAPQEAGPPGFGPATGDTPTDRNLPRAASSATLPMGAIPTTPTIRQDVQSAAPTTPRQPTTAPTQPATEPAPPAPASAATASGAATSQRGRPVVVSRSSVTHADRAATPRRGRGQWIAGAVAAFGLAGALVLISVFQLTRDGGPAQAPAVSSTPGPAAAAPPAFRPNPAAPAPTVPPPISSQLPGFATPSGAGPQSAAAPPVLASPAAQATPMLPVTVAPAPPTAASSPGAATPGTVLTVVPTARSIAATVVPTLSGGGPRTSEAPSTSADAPPAAPAPGSTGGESEGGPPTATTSPSTDDAPVERPTDELAPEEQQAGAAPAPPNDGGRSNSDLCARGAVVAPGLAARAGCRPPNSNSSN